MTGSRRRSTAYVAFVVAGVLGMWRVETTAQKAQDTAEDAQELRAEVMCPLYGELLRSDTPERRAQLKGEELARFEHAIKVLRKGADTLGCPDTGG